MTQKQIKMKKKIYTPPILEELSVDDIQLLAGSVNGAEASGPGSEPGVGNDPFSAPEYQFNEVE